MFEVVPAIDVSRGRLATIGATGPEPLDAFEGDPLAAAARAVEAGARRLHVVDLDLAFEGVPRNLDVLATLAELRVPIQAAGGVRTAREVDALLGAGASRVVLGSAGLKARDAAAMMIERLGEQLVIGIEVDGGRVRSRGRDLVDLDLMGTLGWVVGTGARTLLVTSIARVGRRSGPDVELVRRVARAGRPVLAAGGIASIEDLRDLRAAGAAGAVVGRASLDGTIDLADAIALGAQLDPPRV